jgi:hypothetical protein
MTSDYMFTDEQYLYSLFRVCLIYLVDYKSKIRQQIHVQRGTMDNYPVLRQIYPGRNWVIMLSWYVDPLPSSSCVNRWLYNSHCWGTALWTHCFPGKNRTRNNGRDVFCAVRARLQAKHIHKRHTHLVIERMLYKDCDARVQLKRKFSGRESQGAWHQDEVTGGKPPPVK